MHVTFCVHEDGIFIAKSTYFIERNGMWVDDHTPDGSDDVWTKYVTLKEKYSLFGLANMRPDWEEMYKVPGGHYFSVCMNHSPYFETIQIANVK